MTNLTAPGADRAPAPVHVGRAADGERAGPRRRDPNAAWRSPWVVGWVLLLLTVLAVNGVFITLAYMTSPGLVVSDAYERGQALERNITTRAAAAPDWTMRIDTPPDLVVDTPGWVRFVVVDRAGQPVGATSVIWRAYRPADADLDFELPMIEEAPGRYAAQVSFPAPGIWDTLVIANGEAGEEGVIEQRISVARP